MNRWIERQEGKNMTGKKKKKKMDNMTKLLIPLAVAINMLAYNVLYSTTMVILGDSIGTILVGAICGPVPGAVVGVLSNLVNVIKNPVMIVMLPLNVAFGVVSGYLSKRKIFIRLWKTILCTPLYGFIGGWLSGSIIFLAMGGDFWGNMASVFVGIPLFHAGVPKYFAMAIGQLLFDCIDKAACLVLVYLIIKSLPDRFLIKLPYGRYVTSKQYDESEIEF
ncbi:hypothetical protein D7X88_12315 [bacterium C-53]|nr:hypothetical protein [Lachnospiraceae bacterium]NBI03804.1 hypothetical protein [Lachnospiraceae bacterium]RKJ09151.1 hypothetical protein D7X88_12315 [bacterium C-53]